MASAAQVYIIEKPSALVIYNSYEARVNDMDKFIPYSAFEIVKTDELLGDGISEVIKVKYLGETYFILKNEKGKIEYSEKAGQIKKINVISCNDTLSPKSNPVVKSGNYPGNKNVSSSFKSVAVSQFKYNGYYYLVNSNENVLGWSSISSWKKVIKADRKNEKRELSDNQIAMLSEKIKEINSLYSKAFNYYNDKLNESKSAPYWKIERNGDIIRFKLRGSSGVIRQMEESSQYIVQDFLNILLGEPFDVKYQAGEITVSPEEVL